MARAVGFMARDHRIMARAAATALRRPSNRYSTVITTM
jgi:hypothetical protein